ncbi:MAG: hypothetical protein ABI609_08250 [Acidobacteriota bacterium]
MSRLRRPFLGAGLAWGAFLLTAQAAAPEPPDPMRPIENRYADLRQLQDSIDTAAARGLTRFSRELSLASARQAYGVGWQALNLALATPDVPSADADRLALAAMRRSLQASLTEADGTPGSTNKAARSAPCDYDVAALAKLGLAALQERMYDCYGRAAQTVRFDGRTLDRLTVLARLAETDDPGARKRLFMALDPVWRSVNGDDSPRSAYRQMVHLSAAQWAAAGSPVDRNAAALGVDPAQAEHWLVSVLEAWRDATPTQAFEPWDLHYRAGALARSLAKRIPRERLREIHDAFYRSLGADPATLPIRYDLEPRAGKTPVAFTTFGLRPRQRGATWTPGEAWVFATYRTGGIDNLVELLHETGHAVHILAIHTRPAFADWPDSDTFTEGLGDLIALEAYEPAWQQRWLGASAPLADSLRAKYSSIVLDIAWALFEIRMHRAPDSDPNQVWSDLTHEYLHVVRHPELSWWALRGQLVDSPGYMMNYALGAILVADLRQRCRELRAPFERPDAGMYAWLTERLYRFGLEKTSRAVVEDFLGREISPQALIADLERGRVGETPAPAPKPAR